MKFLVTRSTEGAVSKKPPCKGAVRGPDSGAWPGEFQWFVELGTLEDLTTFMNENGGGLGWIAPEDDEEYPVLEIFDDDKD